MSVSQLDISTSESSDVTFANTMSHDVTWEISSGSARKVRTSIVGIAAACSLQECPCQRSKCQKAKEKKDMTELVKWQLMKHKWKGKNGKNKWKK